MNDENYIGPYIVRYQVPVAGSKTPLQFMAASFVTAAVVTGSEQVGTAVRLLLSRERQQSDPRVSLIVLAPEVPPPPFDRLPGLGTTFFVAQTEPGEDPEKSALVYMKNALNKELTRTLDTAPASRTKVFKLGHRQP